MPITCSSFERSSVQLTSMVALVQIDNAHWMSNESDEKERKI